ncbi:unnamed protein product [Polarella glacialis]|uniref:Aminotransferase class I/classII large domain-containing protein n=1 Tax=Polarella glacialis TaxID=89957 RepID=A0A813KC89_POLGL|nr:unnamed protein product [Polarella glacialis]CAE8696377.1 unnamed protein product [Polarella glacialis]|mmetsp:Transcript_58426/g.94513  ORF Transcript_58426/g.94513 Transcript_58426/m.94513 type:complete len:395 (-) Transcript_58426:51-1235(-)
MAMILPPFKLEEWFAKYEFSAQHQLCNSDCETLTVEELLKLDAQGMEGALQGLLSMRLGYTECTGAPSLREAIASNMYSSMTAEEILVHAGAEEAIFTFAMQFGPGDHVVVMAPCYQSLSAVMQSRGVEVSFWTLREVDEDSHGPRRWAADMEDLQALLRSETRAVVINCPHNPTGFTFTQEELQLVIEACRSRGAYLFSDEVYSGLEHPSGRQTKSLPKACDLYDRAVCLGVVSKAQGLAGLRIGWVASKDRDLLGAMCGVKLYTSICSSGPSEYLAEIAVRHSQELCSRNLTIIEDNLHHLQALLEEFQDMISMCLPSAGCIGLLRLEGKLQSRSAEALAVDAVQKAGVLLLPSEYFDFGSRHFRIGFGRADFKDSLEHFRAFLRQLRSESP